MTTIDITTADTINVRTKRCFHCGDTTVVALNATAFAAWQGGAYIQDAFPHMKADERELLISGTHPACWTAMFSDDEEN
jgi:hypothetical protein